MSCVLKYVAHQSYLVNLNERHIMSWKKDYREIRYISDNSRYIQEKTKELTDMLESHVAYLIDFGYSDEKVISQHLEQQANSYCHTHGINLHDGILSQIVQFFMNPKFKSTWIK